MRCLIGSIWLAVSLMLSGAGVARATCGDGGEPQTLQSQTMTLTTGQGPEAFALEIADQERERQIGMMYRDGLPAGQGMLFLFPFPQRAAFWMENTCIPLDIIFIRSNGRIDSIHENAEPLSRRSLPSRGAVLAVLELRGGAASRLGLAPGQRLIDPANLAGGR